MTSRSPLPQNRSTSGVNQGNNVKQNDQSLSGNDKAAIENNPVNRVYRQPYSDNYSSLFDVQYYDYPVQRRVDKSESKNPETKPAEKQVEPENNRKESYTAVERETKAADARVDSVNYKLEELNSDYRGIPGRVGEVDVNMASNGYKIDELEMRHKLQSARIHDLERQLQDVRMESNNIKGQFPPGHPRHGQQNGQNGAYDSYGQNGNYAPPRGNDPEFDPYQQSGNQAYPGAREMAQRRQAADDIAEKRIYKNEQHHTYHGTGEKDGEAYWGFNKYYKPDFSTAYRREHIPYTTLQEQKTQQIPGGLYIVRFHNNGTDNVNLSYKEQQTIIKSFNGHVIGMAGRDCRSTPNIMVLSGESDWRHSKEGLADNVAMLWFPSRDKAFDFFSNSFRNRFKEQGFPSPHGWESYFIPMNTPILIMSLNTYLIVEVLNRGKHTANDIKTVEEHGARMIKGRIPNSLPFVAACDFRAREAFKPGPLFGDRSTIFISRFGSMNDAREVWESGMMNEALAAGGFTAPTKAVIIQLHDWMDL